MQILGEELDAQNISDNSFPVTLDANLAAGQYFVVLMNSKQLETLPILIQR